MPAIFDSLVTSRHLTAHVAWRVSFIVPFIVITVTAITMLLVCPDTPTGKWSERHLAAQQNLASHGITGEVVDVPSDLADKANQPSTPPHSNSSSEKDPDHKLAFSTTAKPPPETSDHEAALPPQTLLDTARGEIVTAPTLKSTLPVLLSPQTLVTSACYFCTFGAELAINSILGAYYLHNFPKLGQTGSGRWAAMFGLLNIVARPAGGLASDYLYRRAGVWGKKYLLHTLAVLTGVFEIAIGVTNSHTKSTMMGLVAGLAFFLEGSNGATFSLVPHVHPHANGVVSGVTGATGNLGGIIFAIIFRYLGVEYGRTVWIIGVITVGVNVAVCWIRPVPKHQVGGR